MRDQEYLYLIKRKRHKSETCFNLARIGSEMHVKIGQNCFSVLRNLKRGRELKRGGDDR